MKKFLSILCISIIVTSCVPGSEQSDKYNELDIFLEKVEKENLQNGPVISSASWISSNFITYDSQKVIADYGTRYTLDALNKARKASTFDSLDVSQEKKRMLNILKTSFVMPPPLDDILASELSEITTSLEAMYGLSLIHI